MLGTVELVTFRLLRGTPEDFVESNAAVSAWLKDQPGFVSRYLAQRDDGSFIDVVLWQSHAAAMAASEKMNVEMGDSEMMAMIDPMSLTMSHGEIRLAVGA